MNSRSPLENQQQELRDPDSGQGFICRLEWISRAIAAARKHPERQTPEPEPPTTKLRIVG